MTKRSLARCFRMTAELYLLAVLGGVAFRVFDSTKDAMLYNTFKDLIPLIIAIPAIWLGHCLQRRSSYLQQLRTLWSLLVDAVQECAAYTYLESPRHEQHLFVLKKLAISIDEVRGVFTNLKNPKGTRTLYPFEPIKNIYLIIEKFGFTGRVESEREQLRKQVFALWREVRDELLKEFDREVPSFPHSHWADSTKVGVYEDHGIEREAT